LARSVQDRLDSVDSFPGDLVALTGGAPAYIEVIYPCAGESGFRSAIFAGEPEPSLIHGDDLSVPVQDCDMVSEGIENCSREFCGQDKLFFGAILIPVSPLPWRGT
jgi:hypothetical protein